MISRYRKTATIEAEQYTAESCVRICAWAGVAHEGGFDPTTCGVERLGILTLEGYIYASPGDWIARGIKGEFWPIEDDVFRATYKAVEE